MKQNKRNMVWLVAVVMGITLLLIGVAALQQPAAAQESVDARTAADALSAADASSVADSSSADGNWLALSKVPRFLRMLDKDGYTAQEGTFEFVDLVKETCEGRVPNTLANNPWPNAYVVPRFDPPEGAPVPIQWQWQLGEDEAVVLIGQTPPQSAYFSYQTFLGVLPDDPSTGVNERLMTLGVAVGDATNIATIKTLGSRPFNRPIVYIITGNKTMERSMRAAARAAGYPASVINVEAISEVIAPLGYGPTGSVLYMGHRVAGAADAAAVEAYIKDPPYRVFRVSPPADLPDDPQPVPTLRVKGTGKTEMELYPALKRLRQAILDTYASRPTTELDTAIWNQVEAGRPMTLEKPYVALQRNALIIGATRDTNYLKTSPDFKLREGVDEFVIVYGVNHQKTGKVTYSSLSLYADVHRWFGVGTMLSLDFGDSARRYLPDDPDADMLYAVKVARSCPADDPYCLELGFEPIDINGDPYACVLDDLSTPEIDPKPLDLDTSEMFIVFRTYMEPATKIAPDDNELLYDRAIHFAAAP